MQYGNIQNNLHGGRDMDMRNEYDDGYVMGYFNGYHGLTSVNPYDRFKQPQYHIKYGSGYQRGKLLKVKENKE